MVSQDNPVFRALYNDVILHIIFRNLPSPVEKYGKHHYLRNCRLVCQKWNEVIVSQISTRFTLSIPKYFHGTDSTETPPPLTKQLARRINIPMRCENERAQGLYPEDDSLEPYPAPNVKGNLRRFCEAFGDQLEHILFNRDEQSFPDLLYVLENNLCPNLRSLQGCLYSLPAPLIVQLPTMPCFEMMQIACGIDASYLSMMESYKNFEQAVVNTAPNLKEITYYGQFYLDFTTNKRLTSIRHAHSDEDGQVLGTPGLLDTLTQTAPSLEQLFLEFQLCDEDWNIPPRPEVEPHRVLVEFPKMPNLTTLTLQGTHNAQVVRHLGNLRPTILPNLRNLCLSNKIGDCATRHAQKLTILQELKSSVDNKPVFVHDNVVKLVLMGVGDPELLSPLQVHFPSLQDLTVELFLPTVEGPPPGDREAKSLKELMEGVKHLKLKNLRIIVPFKYDIVELVDALEDNYEALFDGMKEFRVENKKGMKKDTLAWKSVQALEAGKPMPITVLEKIFLQIKKVQGLEVYLKNFQFDGVTAHRMMQLVLDNKIPIHFTCEED